ncbi:MAG: TetR/AcrR family transcriptional regulator [Clostridium sp.]|uniref:TetR/AcrR family transcriptional regulator n=1 Tax=Clostridium sp. TaxID=1506 RepID=UPI00258065F5|nr:TetR/AcrR family transcriptional regulator [Clostridium sp.]MBS4842674.1 TetR/AcrR family transcriptional regulator [Clostridium sp.]
MEKTHAKEVKIDKRSLKTKKAIKKALKKLMCSTDISKITIKEIAIEADINRKTFYTHYTDVFSVLKEIEDDLTSKLINKDIEFYNLLLSYSSFSNLINKITFVLKEYIYNYCTARANINNTSLPYVVNFISAGVISSYQEWLNSEKKITLEELSETLSVLIAGGINSIV